jgi:hypothetical protein
MGRAATTVRACDTPMAPFLSDGVDVAGRSALAATRRPSWSSACSRPAQGFWISMTVRLCDS